jgi:hypothetical protein
MARRWKSSTYVKVRRWVDHDLVTYPRHSLALQGSFILVFVIGLGAYAGKPVALVAFWFLIFPLWVAWAVFVLWRVSRLTRAAAILGDRQYDQKTRFMLPPEYADSESVTAASRRRRLNARRQRAPAR